MSGFLYFLPNLKTVCQDDFIRAGIDSIFNNETYSQVEVIRGPGEYPGVVLACTENSPVVGFYPQKQIWQKCNKGKFWLGIEKESEPAPSELARDEVVDGHYVRLEDGNDWLIPVARVFPQGTCLPESLVLGPDGELVREILPRFAKLSSRAEQVWSEFQNQLGVSPGVSDEEPKEFSLQEQWDIAVSSLAINYRIGSWEASFLKLFSTAGVVKVLSALVDVPTLIEISRLQRKQAGLAADKKKQAGPAEAVLVPGGSSTVDGKPDGLKTTFPPTQISPGLAGEDLNA